MYKKPVNKILFYGSVIKNRHITVVNDNSKSYKRDITYHVSRVILIGLGGIFLSYNPLLYVTIVFSLITMCVAFLYFKRINRAQEKYEEAKDVIENVIVSFNTQLKKQKDMLESVIYKTRALALKADETRNKIQVLDSTDERIKKVSMIENRMLVLDKKVGEIVNVQEGVVQKIVDLEKILLPKAEIETVIPIRKEKVLASLTETELMVLEILTNEGEKTAPEIKKRIDLSREHTSRLMRKLYENGYLERDTRKAPYVYHVKNEMLRIMKRM